MAQSFSATTNQAAADSNQTVAKLTELKQLFEAQLINEAEYTAKKQQILAKF
jgi:hypothetical protein